MTTIKESGLDDLYGFPERICDNCENLIEGNMHLHWERKDFDICADCLMELYQKVFKSFSNNDIKNNVYKKAIIPNELRWEIWRRDNFTCQYCGISDNLSVDHILPESQGGKLIAKNLVAACKSCNSRKKDRTPEEAGMKLITDPRM